MKYKPFISFYNKYNIIPVRQNIKFSLLHIEITSLGLINLFHAFLVEANLKFILHQ